MKPKAHVLPNISEQNRNIVEHLNQTLHHLYRAKIQTDILLRDETIEDPIRDEIEGIRQSINDLIETDCRQEGVKPLTKAIKES